MSELTKEDIRDLRRHIDERFDKQDKHLAGMRSDIQNEAKVNVSQCVKIEQLEKDVDLLSSRMWKAVAAGCAVAVLAVWDAFIKGRMQ